MSDALDADAVQAESVDDGVVEVLKIEVLYMNPSARHLETSLQGFFADFAEAMLVTIAVAISYEILFVRLMGLRAELLPTILLSFGIIPIAKRYIEVCLLQTVSSQKIHCTTSVRSDKEVSVVYESDR